MATPSANGEQKNSGERSRAFRIRKALAAKDKVSDEDRRWLVAYDKRVAEPRTPPRAKVHQTIPSTGPADPNAFGWIPTVPKAPEGADRTTPPPGAGVPPPPIAGTPLVDAQPPPQPQGDPHAAQQFAKLVLFLTVLGIKAGKEMLEQYELPEEFKDFVDDPNVIKEALELVGTSAERVAIKYNFRSIPMGDELTVGAAIAGSILVIVANSKRKREHPQAAKPKLRSVPLAPSSTTPATPPGTPSPADSGSLDGLWK